MIKLKKKILKTQSLNKNLRRKKGNQNKTQRKEEKGVSQGGMAVTRWLVRWFDEDGRLLVEKLEIVSWWKEAKKTVREEGRGEVPVCLE